MILPISAAEVCQIAKSAYEAGDNERGDKFYNIILRSMLNFCDKGNADGAIACELLMYRILVKFRETEDSTEAHFARWRDKMYALGLRERDESLWSKENGIGFVVQTLFSLAHNEVLYQTLKLVGPRPVYVIGQYGEEIKARFEEIGCKVTSAYDHLSDGGRKTSITDRLKWLRARMAADGIGVAVWNSTVTISSYAFGLGLAPKHVMWSHRFHPHIPGSVCRIAYGAEDEKTYHGQVWKCCKPPMVDWDRLSERHAIQTSGQFTFGTIARDEKIENPLFLDTVIRILKSCPDARYEFTGRIEPRIVRNIFKKEGVSDRCHYIGWVDQLHVASFDAFLETFPLGGICALYALAQGVPVVAMRSNHNPLTHGGLPVSDTVDEYVDAAIALYQNPFERKVAKDSGFEYIEGERRETQAQARRLMGILESL